MSRRRDFLLVHFELHACLQKWEVSQLHQNSILGQQRREFKQRKWGRHWHHTGGSGCCVAERTHSPVLNSACFLKRPQTPAPSKDTLNWNKKLQTKFFMERASTLILMEAIGRQSPFFPALKKMETPVLKQF